MFCNKCGCKIPVNASRCPNCGADIPSMEYCSGFWSELNQNSQANGDAADIKKQELRNRNTGTEPEGSIPNAGKAVKVENAAKPYLRFNKYALIAEAVIIAVLLLYHVVSAASLRGELNKTQKEYSSVNEEMEKLNETIKDLRQEISERDALIRDYEERIRTLTEQPAQTEDQNAAAPDEEKANPGEEDANTAAEGTDNPGEGAANSDKGAANSDKGATNAVEGATNVGEGAVYTEEGVYIQQIL